MCIIYVLPFIVCDISYAVVCLNAGYFCTLHDVQPSGSWEKATSACWSEANLSPCCEKHLLCCCCLLILQLPLLLSSMLHVPVPALLNQVQCSSHRRKKPKGKFSFCFLFSSSSFFPFQTWPIVKTTPLMPGCQIEQFSPKRNVHQSCKEYSINL